MSDASDPEALPEGSGTTVNKVRNGLLEPSPQFAKKVREEFGQVLWGLWSAWDARHRRAALSPQAQDG